MSYSNTESIILKLGGNNTVLCSKSLLQESEIFKDMMFFGTSSMEPIKLPPFVTENILVDIISILDLKEKALETVLSYTEKYCVDFIKVADYLSIETLLTALKNQITERLNETTCVEIYIKTRGIPTLSSYNLLALAKLMKEIEKNYEGCQHNVEYQDPYLKIYQNFPISDIDRMLSTLTKYSTQSKILCLYNWWRKNRGIDAKAAVLEMLKDLSDSATYIPRKEIIYMRQIRDVIREDANKLDES